MQEIILKNNQSENFTLISYPDGQHSIKLNLNKLNVKETVFIKCRIRNFGELEVLLCLVTALRKHDFHIEEINFVYLFGMRSDRAFEVGEPNYFRDVVNPILKLLDCKMTFLAPHNVKQVENHYYGYLDQDNDFPIAGDESALLWCNFSRGHFKKQRKEKIEVTLFSKTSIHETDRDLLIVDDLCDGGATFIAEGEYLKKFLPNKKLKLFVYHGLFTQGVHNLLNYFDEIICTNSYQDIDNPRVKQIKVI